MVATESPMPPGTLEQDRDMIEGRLLPWVMVVASWVHAQEPACHDK